VIKISNWNLGSAANAIQNIVPNMPLPISGTQLLDIVDRQRLFMEGKLNVTIGSVGIVAKYQPALISLSLANVLPLIHLGGGDTSIGEVRLGMSAMQAAQHYKEQGMEELRRLEVFMQSYKVLG